MQLSTFFGRATHALRAGFMRLTRTVKRWGIIKTALGLVVVLIIAGALLSFVGGTVAPIEAQDQTPAVTVVSVADLSSNTSPLSIIGTVNSVSEATVRAEKSGEVKSVSHSLGDYVTAGTIIAQLENSSERAAVLQAQGVVEAATASAGVSQTTLGAAKDTAVTTLLSAYAAADNAVHSSADPMFSNPESARPQLNVQSSDTQAKINAENQRGPLSALIARESARSKTITSSDDLISEFTRTEAELRQVRDFFDVLIQSLNSGIATYGTTDADIAADKAAAGAGRTAITAAISASISARQALETAQKNTSQGGASANSATQKQAQGALAAAQSNLEKTIIRAPISGTINSLPLKRGDFVQMSSLAVTIANNGALEVKAYITDQDAREIAVGSSAAIETSGVQTGVAGVITHIAPALDPTTRKIEVRVGITQGGKLLVNGQSVIVNFTRTTHPTTATITGRITIPIAALKVGGSDMSVFTVDATSSTLVPHTVKIGALLGDRVVIEEGVTPDMKIVTDARGLRAGEVVVLK